MGHEAIGKIEHIAIYPVKSAGMLELHEATITPEGIVGDRKYMIVRATPNADGVFEFITQRDKRNKEDRSEAPQSLAILSQIKPEMRNNVLNLTWKGKDAITVPEKMDSGQEIPVRIWDDVVQAVDQGDQLAEWLSGHLNLRVRLVKGAGSFRRKARQNYMHNDNTVRFQDGYPVHWFFQASVDELAQRAEENVSWKNFRPNIVVSGSPAQTEHIVHSGIIGDVPFIDPKPCDRCEVTNVDQETGTLVAGRALRPLVKYSRWVNNEGKQKIIFGENMLPLQEGKIKVGDEVVMTEKRKPSLQYR